MKKIYMLFWGLFMSYAVSAQIEKADYVQKFIENQKTPFLNAQVEEFTLDGIVWTRPYGESVYSLVPIVKNVADYERRIHEENDYEKGIIKSKFYFINVELTRVSHQLLNTMDIKVPNFVEDKVLVYLPIIDIESLEENGVSYEILNDYGKKEYISNYSDKSIQSSIWSEDFESESVPGDQYSASNGAVNCGWKDVDCYKHSGSWSVWCAGNGPACNACGYDYVSDMSTYFNKSYNINTSGYKDIHFTYWIYIDLNDAETNDELRRYSDKGTGEWTLAVTMNSSHAFDGENWMQGDVDYSGQLFSEYSFRFYFYSSSLWTSKGVYLDDLELTGTYCSSTAPTSITANPNSVCPGNSTTLGVSGGSLGTSASWKWFSGSCGGTSLGTGATINVSPTSTTTYFVRAEGECNTTDCISTTITVKSSSTVPTSATVNPSSVCSGESTTLGVSGGSLGTNAAWKWYSGSCGGTFVGNGSTLAVNPTTTTTYYVRAEGDCNTTDCKSNTVTVKSSSTVPTGASVNPSTINSGTQATLTVSGGSLGTNADWKWYSGSCGGTFVGNGSPLAVNPTNSTTYYVRAEGDCNTTNCAETTISVSNGIEDIKCLKSYKIYPNPLQNELNFDMELTEPKNVSISIINMQGQEVASYVYRSQSINFSEAISFKEYSNGVYTIQVMIDNEVFYSKLVKE